MADEEKYTLYRTSDIYFASYLCAVEVVLETTERETVDDRSKVVFVFRVPKNKIDRLRAGFFGGHATVKVQAYVQAIRNLKQMCFV